MDHLQTPRRINFFFDYVSHNCYLAWVKLQSLKRYYPLSIKFTPVLFAGLLNAHGQLGPAEIPAKAKWMTRNVLRKAATLGVPLSPPRSHPFNPLLALRVSSVGLKEQQKAKLVSAIFRAAWVYSQDITNPKIMTAILTKVGLDGPQLVQQANTLDIKRQLRIKTDEAIAQGIFGVPSMVVDGELFWGYDDFTYLELFLRGKDPLSQQSLELWHSVQPSSQRNKVRCI